MSTKNNRKCKKMMEAIEFINSKRERVIALEAELESIKRSKEWIWATSTLRSYANTGRIKEAPLKLNGYITTLNDDEEE